MKEPWKMSLKKRLKIYDQARKEGKKIALYYTIVPDNTTFRYRIYNTMQATLESKKWQAVFFCQSEMRTLLELIPKSDLLVLGRQAEWNETVEKIVKTAKDNNVPTVFDLDDLIFDKKYLKLVTESIGEENNLEFWNRLFDVVNGTGRNVDGFILTNEFLAKKVKNTFKKKCGVIRNSINQEQIMVSKLSEKIKKYKRKNEFIIGYFGGSPTHQKDFEMAAPEIMRFLKDYDNTKLKVVGYMKFGEEAKRLLEDGKIQFSPFVDFRKLQYLMAMVDVNIAPLVVNDFTNCKSELKFFEAAIVSTTTIASPTYTFKKTITDGENGFLAQPGEWYGKLEYLYKHPEINRKVARRAKEYAFNHYCGKEFLSEIEETYDSFTR